MYEVKNKIFLELSKTQKSAVCNYLRALSKKVPDLSIEEIFAKFLDDEKYYLEINSPHFEFLKDLLDDEKFVSEAKLYIKECKKYYDYKKSQEPLKRAQKEFDKKKRQFLQSVKMSKEMPTQKQLYYYDTLCKRYKIEKKENENLSKLDLKNMIEEILNEHQTN